MRQVVLGISLILVLALAGCGGRASAQNEASPSRIAPTAAPTATTSTSLPNPSPDESSTRTDDQGAVVVQITPVDLKTSGDVLAFSVSLNTHSVDLSMDLAAAATLSTDNGRSVTALAWSAPKGGHHVSGELTFPALVDGGRLLDGASRLTLTITGLDAPERSFSWDLTP